MAKSAKQRKAEQRAREKQHLIDVGATSYTITAYRAEIEALERVMEFAEIEEVGDIFSRLVRNVDELSKRDPSQAKLMLSL